jgi:hypothetical protein
VGRVGPNGQERSGSGRMDRMAGGPILGKGNGVGLGCHGNQAEMRFGLPAKNRNWFYKFLIQGNGIQIKSFKYFQT